jgi:hypothetical protein
VERPGSEARLARTPDGWWLHFEEQDSVVARFQLWSQAKRKYLRPDLPKLAKGEAPSSMSQFQRTDWTASYYRACPYFGYRGWFLDVINEHGDRADLPAYARYGLARAYSSAARCRLDDLQAEGPPGYGFLSSDEDRLEEAELAAYLDLFRKACRAFTELAASDPSFETHVGEAGLKRDHEFMTGYMDLLMAGEPDAARECVPLGCYTPFYRDLAQAYLASCDSNAVLFTNGDTDTFPLWYVQLVEGYRRDVLVLNLSLLNVPRYIRAMRDGHLGSLPAGWRSSDRFYASPLAEYALLRQGDDTLDLSEATSLLEQADLTPRAAHERNITLPTRRFRMNGPDGTAITWEVPKHYLLRSAIAVFDLLAHNPTRPFHWAVTTGPDAYLGLSGHFALQGLTYKLVRDGVRTDPSEQGVPARVMTRRSSEVFRALFSKPSLDTASINRMRLVTNYVLQVTNTAEAMAAEGDTTGASDLVLRCLATFPNERWPFERVMIKPIELLWDLGRGAEADSLGRLLMDNLKHRPARKGPVDGAADIDQERKIREAVLDRLRIVAGTHGRQQFIAYLDALPATWPDPLVIKQYWPGAARPTSGEH